MLGDSNSAALTSQAAAATITSAAEPTSPVTPKSAIAAREGEGQGESDCGLNSGLGNRPDDDGGERDSFAMEGGEGRAGGERTSGGNRWPKQETLALLQIRMDMDVAFKEASVKGPLWDDVSRKLAELGYHRSAKKCREKFENVFKYHKRTKEGRTGKSEGKTYRFFDQLEAFESQALPLPQLAPSQSVVTRSLQIPAMPATAVMTVGNNPGLPAIGGANVTVPSSAIAPPTLNFSVPSYPQGNSSTVIAQASVQQLPTPQQQMANLLSTQQQTHFSSFSFPGFPTELMSDSSSSSTSSDVEIGRQRNKRKWKDFFEKLLREVLQKQEDMQRRFLEAIEKREQERMMREDAWRLQELARINREREILSQERSISAAKDAAVMAFLRKLSDQQNLGVGFSIIPPPPQSIVPTPVSAAHMISQKQTLLSDTVLAQQSPLAMGPAATTLIPVEKSDNGDPSGLPSASSSRWPKAEVQALIKLRSNLDAKYQESGPKGPLWEEISSEMRLLGYNRSSKRCKEKWENINKYFKKVKESNKARPEDSKTCPYFHQLDALYKEKNKTVDGPSSSILQFRPENSVPLLVQPEQQWPPPLPSRQIDQRQQDSAMEDLDSEEVREDDTDKENEDDEDEASDYQIVANSPSKASSINAGDDI